MPVIRLDSPADARLDDYRNIPDAELIERRGIFVAEGRLIVTQLLEDGRLPVRSVLLTETALNSDPVYRSAAAPIYVVAQEAMNAITGFNIHRGCLAIGERPAPRPWQDLAAAADRLVVVERVANPDNIGAIFRNAAAFGAGAVLLDAASTDPLYRKAIRTSMGAALRIPFARVEPWPAALCELRAGGWRLIGLTPSGETTLADLDAVRAPGARSPEPTKIAIVVGHEGEGLTTGALAACDVHARIPMADGVDSLNVATACAIALYHFRLPRPGEGGKADATGPAHD